MKSLGLNMPMSRIRPCFTRCYLLPAVVSLLLVGMSDGFAQTPPMPPTLSSMQVVERSWNGVVVRMLKGALRVRLAPGCGQSAADVERAVPGVTVVGRYLLPHEVTDDVQSRFARVDDARWLDRRRAEDILVRTFDVIYNDDRSPLEMAQYLITKVPEVDYAEPWYVDEVHVGPNDPRLGEQPAFDVVRGPQAWQIFRGDSSVIIGISDSGVDPNHPDLAPNIAVRREEVPDNGVDDDGNGYVDDYAGYNFTGSMDDTKPGDASSRQSHGTEVSGMAAARTDNGIGIAATGFTSKFFPIKVQPRNSSGVLYGYHSLLYAARTRIPVLNCSWGSPKPYSPIEQALVDYAIANNVVLVASGGNRGNSLQERNYPSAYDGVLGVAESNSSDVVVSSSGLGASVGIIAPSNGSLTTTGFGVEAYATANGTSFASPMVAGMCAVLRARFPQLTARQIYALAKRCAVDVRSQNRSRAQGLPRRMDMLLAVTIDPTVVVALECDRAALVDAAGRALLAAPADGRYHVQFRIENALLAAANNVRVELTTLDDAGWEVSWGDSVSTVAMLNGGATYLQHATWFTAAKRSSLPLVVMATITADGADTVERVLVFDPVSDFYIVENEAMAIGVSSRAAIGSYSAPVNAIGPGVFRKPDEVLVSQCGLVAVANSTQGSRALTYNFDASDFRPVDVSYEPGRLRLVVDDSAAAAADRTNVRIDMTWSFPRSTVPLATIDVVLTNTTEADVVDMGAGVIMDWDVGSGGQQNVSEPAPGAIPDVADNSGTAMQSFWRRGFTTAIVAGVATTDPEARAQNGAGPLPNVAGPPLTASLLNDLFTRGTTMQPTGAGDLAGLHGVLFQGTTPPGGQRRFTIIIALGTTVAEASQRVFNHLLPTSVGNIDEHLPTLKVTPIPAQQYATLTGTHHGAEYTIIDVRGVVVKRGIASDERTIIDLRTLPAGVYQAVVTHGLHGTTTGHIVVFE